MDRRAEFQKQYDENGPFFDGEEVSKWTRNGITVYFCGLINSGGSVVADYFVNYVMAKWPSKKFGSVLEIGSGPGFVGFGLLAAGLCETLVLSDIEPSMKTWVDRTIVENKLQDRVFCYISDALKDIPKQHKFDLVVGTPPSRYVVDEEYPVGTDNREEIHQTHWYDLGLQFTSAFFHQVPAYLNDGGKVLWSWYMPLDSWFQRYPGGKKYKRAVAPIAELKHIIDNSNLYLTEITHPENSMSSFWIMVAIKTSMPATEMFII